jgi:WD40 repeat protein
VPPVRAALEAALVADDRTPETRTLVWADIPAPGQPCGRLGPYELLEPLGSGGMGVVYRARQPGLDRLVAIKTLAGGLAASPEVRRRFRTEARAAARLSHPHIVPVIEVGDHEDLPYIVMELVEGTDLERLTAEAPLSPARAARYVRDVARAVVHAHQRGIVHRDLKPANVLLDRDDRVLVTDFGLAKDIAAEPTQTLSGQVLGSPGFLSPEQAGGGDGEVGPASDIYSLGALLYHLLTRRPPFLAAGVAETLRQVVETEPAPPTSLNPSIPGALEAICLRCLEKRPASRYPDAQSVAADLDAFLGDQPVRLAGRPGLRRRSDNWRASPVWGVAAAALTVALVTVTLAGLRLRNTVELRDAALLRAHRTVDRLESLRDRLQYGRHIQEADRAVRDGNEPEASVHLDQTLPAWRGWEHDLLRAQASSGSRVLGSLGSLPRQVAISAEGEWIAAGTSDGTVGLWNRTEVPAARALAAHRGAVTDLDFSRDGRRLVSVGEDGEAVVWDVVTMTENRRIPASRVHSRAARWVGDPPLLLTAGIDGMVRVWEEKAGREPRAFEGTGEPVLGLAASADGTRVAAAGADGGVSLWDVATGRRLPSFAAHRGAVVAAAFAGASQTLVTAGRDGYLRVWNPDANRSSMELRHGLGTLRTLASSPACPWVLSGGADGLIRFWDLEAGHVHRTQTSHRAGIADLAISADGRWMASVSFDRHVRLWPLEPDRLRPYPRNLGAPVTALAFHPDEHALLWGDQDGNSGLLEVTSGRDLQRIPGAAGRVVGAAVLPDGTNALLAWSGGRLEFRDLRSGGTSREAALPGVLRALAVSPDGRSAAAGGDGGRLHLFPTSAPFSARPLPGTPTRVTGLVFEAEGRRIFASGEDGLVYGWDLPDGRPIDGWRAHAARVRGLAYHPPTGLIATVSVDQTARLWDPSTRGEVGRLAGHAGAVSSAAFAPGQERLATGGADGTTRVWDFGSSQCLLTFEDSPAGVRAVAWSGSGRLLASGHLDGTLWVRGDQGSAPPAPATH